MNNDTEVENAKDAILQAVVKLYKIDRNLLQPRIA